MTGRDAILAYKALHLDDDKVDLAIQDCLELEYADYDPETDTLQLTPAGELYIAEVMGEA